MSESTSCKIICSGFILCLQLFYMEPAFSIKHQVSKQKTNTSSKDSLFPSSAYDYLKFVQDEAASCPDVVVADIDCSNFRANQEPSFISQKSLICSSVDINEENKISLTWQEEQTAAFSEIRQFLVHHKALLKNKKETVEKVPLPAANNESMWFTFCFGRQNQTNNSSVIEESKSDIADQKEDKGSPALLSIICSMNQPTVLSVLDHHVMWLETKPFSLLQGQWIYALLAAVEKPLLADTTYSLRCLARLCSQQIEKLTSTQNSEMAGLYLIITLVTRYFGQSDLNTPT